MNTTNRPDAAGAAGAAGAAAGGDGHGDAAAAAAASSTPAPTLPIVPRAISSVEHPCIVKNVDKGVTSLGGPVILSKNLRTKLEPQINEEGEEELPGVISASLRPDDPFAKRVLSTPVTTSNLLIKVTVPKRTGRRRKRGSSGPFVADGPAGPSASGPVPAKTYTDAATLYRTLQDTASRYMVSVAGVVDETHRFRSMPDIQYSVGQNSIMTGIRDYLLPGRHSLMKAYNINTAAGPDPTKELGPSAEYFQMPIAWNYQFEQNANVKYTKDKSREINVQRTLTYTAYTVVDIQVPKVPTGPKAELPPERTLSSNMQSLIAKIRTQLARRPIMTRHLLYNKLGWAKRDRIRMATMYCGYFFETGPWREALILWGVDPRKDPKYRHYQTISFLSYLKRGSARHFEHFDAHIRELANMPLRELEKQHTFDGVHVSHTGNLFQFCDISDPLIRKILDTNDIRSTCAPTFQGWYHVGTWAKATVVLKDKMNQIIGKETPDDSIYERILTWPENWEDKDLYATYRDEMFDREVHKQKAREHEVMNYVRWAARNPRYAFEKLDARGGFGPEATEADVLLEDPEVPEDTTEAKDTAEIIYEEGDDGDDDFDEDDTESDEEVDLGPEFEGIWQDDDLGADEEEDEGPPVQQKDGPLPFGGLYRK
ncbi:hypothetical protein BS50DRAFT_616018 [Corynespora cassiicola Philippines]|uniref:Transcription factor tfiiic complex a box associated subunit sfc1 n=1 Tax=Corynespora cassiicola Philippines TaxID=1448308 RepID=A0A2T2PCI5_CORCC|nr:hypothetical protein BS50DRAFT_616018 [Corynespora cassiicola Philippines]